MQLSNFDRIVVMAVDVRYPEFAHRTVQGLLDHGATQAEVFLNGRQVRPDSKLVHQGEPPESWTNSRNLWDYFNAYRTVIAQAHRDGVERLLITEDDIEFSTNFDAVTMRAQVPKDWQLVYFGAFHHWASTPAQSVSPYVVRLNGGQVGIQAVGWRSEAMKRFLELPVDRPPDWAIADLHQNLPSYCLHPAVIRQAEGVMSTTVPCEPFTSGFLYEIT